MNCDLENANVYYEQRGEGRPILMLHGGNVDHRQMMGDMEPVFENLDGWLRIYPDLPGHGKTTCDSTVENHDQVLEILLAFIDKVVAGEKFCVAGLSTGGYLARGIAHKRRANINGILLLVPARYADAPASSVPTHQVIASSEKIASSVKPEENAIFGKLVVQSQEALDRLRDDFFPGFKLADQQLRTKLLNNYEFSFDVDDLPEPITKPALIITGRQDAVVGYTTAWSLLPHFPHATFAVLDMSGHLITVEQIDLVRSMTVEWIERVNEYGWAN